MKRIKLLSIPGRLLGTICCLVLFAIAGAFYGVVYPWICDKESWDK